MKIIAIVGKSGSGKSTYAKKFAKKNNGWYYDCDCNAKKIIIKYLENSIDQGVYENMWENHVKKFYSDKEYRRLIEAEVYVEMMIEIEYLEIMMDKYDYLVVDGIMAHRLFVIYDRLILIKRNFIIRFFRLIKRDKSFTRVIKRMIFQRNIYKGEEFE